MSGIINIYKETINLCQNKGFNNFDFEEKSAKQRRNKSEIKFKIVKKTKLAAQEIDLTKGTCRKRRHSFGDTHFLNSPIFCPIVALSLEVQDMSCELKGNFQQFKDVQNITDGYNLLKYYINRPQDERILSDPLTWHCISASLEQPDVFYVMRSAHVEEVKDCFSWVPGRYSPFQRINDTLYLVCHRQGIFYGSISEDKDRYKKFLLLEKRFKRNSDYILERETLLLSETSKQNIESANDLKVAKNEIVLVRYKFPV